MPGAVTFVKMSDGHYAIGEHSLTSITTSIILTENDVKNIVASNLDLKKLKAARWKSALKMRRRYF